MVATKKSKSALYAISNPLLRGETIRDSRHDEFRQMTALKKEKSKKITGKKKVLPNY